MALLDRTIGNLPASPVLVLVVQVGTKPKKVMEEVEKG